MNVSNDLPWIDEDGETIEEMPIFGKEGLAAYLPSMLTWDHEPEARAGDQFVFRWAKHVEIVHGKAFTAEFADVYVKLTAHPIRHKKGHWQAPIVRVGFERTVYMARGGGSTTNPLRAIDRDVPLEKVEKDAEQERGEAQLRRSRIKDERISATRGAGPGQIARVRKEMSRFDDAA